MNLYESKDIEEQIELCADPLTGEIQEDKIVELVKYQTSSLVQLEKLGNYIMHLDSFAALAADEIKRMQELKKRAERRSESLKAYIAPYIAFKGGKVTAGVRQFGIRKSEQVALDESILQSGYFKEKVLREPDKKLIKEAIKDGIHVNGAWLVEKENLNVK